MPTENRSSNTDMVSVPRHTLENVLNDGSCKAEVHAAFIRARNDIERLLTLPAEQHQGEPVKLPAYKLVSDYNSHDWDEGYKDGWGACLDEIAKLGPLYIRADPGEVERLRTGLDHMREERDDLSRKLDRFYSRTHGIKNLSVIEQLSDMLAERDSLLQQALQFGGLTQEWHDKVAALSASAEPSAPTVSIPDGYCLMPKLLTAENGAKALLLGEFKLNVVRGCPECRDLEEPVEGCDVCDGEGEFAQSHTISWDQIKLIYSEAVKGLALLPNATRKAY